MSHISCKLVLSSHCSTLTKFFIPFKLCFSHVAIVPLCSANLQSRVRKGQMTQEKFEKTLSLLKGVLDYESFRDVDLVIEVRCSSVNFIIDNG